MFLPAASREDLDAGLRAGSELAAALDRVLPVPLVDYGLDYV
jgi:hypothetical protein